MQKNGIGSLSYIIHKYQLNLNIRPETVKFLEKDIEVKFHVIDLGNDFLDLAPKAQTKKYK